MDIQKKELNIFLMNICIKGDVKMLKYLLTLGADPSENNNFSIIWSSFYGHMEIVKLLLEDKRVDPSSQNNFALRNALVIENIEIIILLLSDYRVNPTNFNFDKYLNNEKIKNLLFYHKCMIK